MQYKHCFIDGNVHTNKGMIPLIQHVFKLKYYNNNKKLILLQSIHAFTFTCFYTYITTKQMTIARHVAALFTQLLTIVPLLPSAVMPK